MNLEDDKGGDVAVGSGCDGPIGAFTNGLIFIERVGRRPRLHRISWTRRKFTNRTCPV